MSALHTPPLPHRDARTIRMRPLLHSLPLALLLVLSFAPTAKAELLNNGDGTVTDTETDLMWDRCLLGTTGLDCDIEGAPLSLNWPFALQQVVLSNASSHRGYSDWRLPNIQELESIIDLSREDPAFDTTAFPGSQAASELWSSTTDTASGGAWAVWVQRGSFGSRAKDQFEASLRLVRGGDAYDRLRDAPRIFGDGFEAPPDQ